MLYANDAATLLVQDAARSYFLLNDAGNILVEENTIQIVDDSISERENATCEPQQLIYYTDEITDESDIQFVAEDVKEYSDDVLSADQVKMEPYEVQMTDENAMIIDRWVFVFYLFLCFVFSLFFLWFIRFIDFVEFK